MHLFTLRLNPLITCLNAALNGITIGSTTMKTVTTCYADDVTIFITSPEDIPKLEEVLRLYEQASGASNNMVKSKALALGGWSLSHRIMGIPYANRLTILGLRFMDTVRATCVASWKRVTDNIRAKTKGDYARKLTLHTGIQYVHALLYAKAWYLAQVLTPP
jgi:hypothetical protein